MTSVNRVKHIGEVDVDPNLQKTEIIADIRFGNFETKKQKITAEKRGRAPWELIISLSHLSLSGEIKPDGSVTLNNKASFCVDDLIEGEDIILLDAAYTPNVNFDLRKK